MNLPPFIFADPATLALIVRSKIVGDLPATSYDDAWDALTQPEDYTPSDEVQAWMRENWHGPVFGAEPQPEPDGEAGESAQNRILLRPLARSWMPKFLDVFVSTGGNASEAARQAGVAHRTPYNAKDSDKNFAQAWEWAERQVADVIRGEMHRRGIIGWEEPVYGTLSGKFAGEGCVGAVRKFDSHVLIKMATARVAEYRTLVKEGAPQVNATANASASSSSAVVVDAKKIEDLQARKQRQLEKQAERDNTVKVGNN